MNTSAARGHLAQQVRLCGRDHAIVIFTTIALSRAAERAKKLEEEQDKTLLDRLKE
jgi:hypothetical protein